MTNMIIPPEEVDQMTRMEQMVKAAQGYRTDFAHSSSPLASGLKNNGEQQTELSEKITEWVVSQYDYLKESKCFEDYMGDLHRQPEIVVIESATKTSRAYLDRDETIINAIPEYYWKNVGFLIISGRHGLNRLLEYFENSVLVVYSKTTYKLLSDARCNNLHLFKAPNKSNIGESVRQLMDTRSDLTLESDD